jgi:hypothetical protein
MIIIDTADDGEHLIDKTKTYTLRDLASHKVTTISGVDLIKNLSSDKRAGRPYRYANAKSPNTFIKYRDLNLNSATISVRGVNSFKPANSSSCEPIKIDDNNVMLLVHLLNKRYILITVRRPEYCNESLNLFSFKIATYRERFSIASTSDFKFHFSNLSEKDGVVSSELFVIYTTPSNKEITQSLGVVKVSVKGIEYKDCVMPYIDKSILTKYVLAGTVNDFIP